MGNFRGSQHALYRRLQLHQQRVRVGNQRLLSGNPLGRERGVGSRMNTDDILPFTVDKDQRDAGRLSVNHAHGRNVNVIVGQLGADPISGIVAAGAGDKRNLRPAAPGGHRLVCPFTTKGDLVVRTGHGFARHRESVKVENVIGIDTAKDNELTCCFHGGIFL